MQSTNEGLSRFKTLFFTLCWKIQRKHRAVKTARITVTSTSGIFQRIVLCIKHITNYSHAAK